MKQGKTFKEAVSAWKNRDKKKTITRVVHTKPTIKYRTRTKTVTKVVHTKPKTVTKVVHTRPKVKYRTRTLTKVVKAKPKIVTKIVPGKPQVKYRTRTLTKVVKAKPKIVTKIVPGKTQIKYRTKIVKEKIPGKSFDEDSFFKKFGESLTGSFSKFSEKIGERFDKVEEKFNERFDSVDERIGHIENRVESLESKPQEIDSAVFNVIGEKQDDLLRKLDELIFVLSQKPVEKTKSESEQKTEETVVVKLTEKLLDKATPEEKSLAYNITETYFEDVARLGLKRSLNLDEVIDTYKNVLAEVKAKNSEASSDSSSTELEKAIIRTKSTTKEKGEN